MEKAKAIPKTAKDVPQRVLNDIVTAIRTPMDFYYTKRRDDEIDLVAHVRDRLVSIGMADRLPEVFDNNRFVIEAADKTCHAQQYNLTRYFAMQFMLPKEDTTMERYSLMYECRADEWLDVFDRVILPSLANYDLPRKI